MYVYQCEDSLEGIFTAIYNIYEDRRRPEDVMVSTGEELFLFAEYVPVQNDLGKVEKVIRTLKAKFGEQDYYSLCLALSAEHEGKAQAVCRTIARGIAGKCAKGHLLDDLSNEYVHLTFALGRGAGREYDHLRGFTRFEELEQGILYARVTPKNNILVLLMNHFADRFPMENFMIYDDGHQLLGMHEVSKQWQIVRCDEEMIAKIPKERRADEISYQHLFQYFCHKIAIRERRNLDLQRNMLPLRFRDNMTEFKMGN